MEPLGPGKRLLEWVFGNRSLSGTHEGAPDGFVNGAVVRVRGRRDGATLVAADGATGGQVLASAPGWTGQRMNRLKAKGISGPATPHGAIASARFVRQLRCSPWKSRRFA